MFENFLHGSEQKANLESEKRQISLAREQASMQASTNDQIFYQEQKEKSDLIKWQQDLHECLDSLKKRLRGMVKDSEGNWTTSENISPLMSEQGVEMVETELSPFLGDEAKNMINTNLSEDMILNMLRTTADTITCSIADNYDTFVIEATPSKMSHIMKLIKNVMTPTPYRALEGWTLKENNKGTKRIETFNETGNNKKMWGMI